VRSTAGVARARGRPAFGHAAGETEKKERREEGKEGRKEKGKRKKGKRREGEGERVGAGRGGDRGRSATRAVFARGEREKKRSRDGANHGGRSRVSDEPSSDAGWDSDPVRVRVLTSNHFYELL
jgi:hypothetical protein